MSWPEILTCVYCAATLVVNCATLVVLRTTEKVRADNDAKLRARQDCLTRRVDALRAAVAWTTGGSK